MDSSKIPENFIKIRKPSIPKFSNLNAISNKNYDSAKKENSPQSIAIKQIIIKNQENSNPIDKLNVIDDKNQINKLTKFNIPEKLEKLPILEKKRPFKKEFKKSKSLAPKTSSLPKLKKQFSLNGVNTSTPNKNTPSKKNKQFLKMNSYSENKNNFYSLRKVRKINSIKIPERPCSPKKNIFKFSDFYKKSKDDDISARKIYDHYIEQESKKIIKPINNFTLFIEKKYKIPKNRFKKIYCLDNEYLHRLKEIKCNKYIAFKKDFDIKEYQNALLEMMSDKLDGNRLFCLQQDFQKFNEKLERGCASPKGRFSNLAEKISCHAPLYLINKLKKIDQDNLKAKAKRYKIRSRSMDENDNFDIDYQMNGINNSVLPILNRKK